MFSFRRLTTAAVVLATVGLFAAPGLVLAQSANTGAIDGRVFDESKASLPGASVTARNTGSGLTRSTTVSPTGTYRLTALPAGNYDVTAELSGFAKATRQAVPVQVASTASLDFTMKVATQAEEITVVGEVPLVQTTTSDVGQVITDTMVQNIPLNGRKFQDLSLLVPGTRPSSYYDPTKTEVGGVSYSALTGRSVVINVDGGDDNDGVVKGLLQQFSADAIQEYKVTTQRYSAEFGRSVGGVVNVITKSGTNDLHGSLFVFGRNQSLNARDYFQETEDLDKPDFKQLQFGGTVGGPIVKDKAHYFLSYERNNRDDSATVNTGGILQSAEGSFPQPFRNNLLTAKLDFALNDSNNMIARYALEDQKREHDFIGGNTLANSGATNTNKIHSGIIKNTSVMSNSKVNEALVLFQRFENNIIAENPDVPGITTPDFVYGANINTPQQTIQKRWQLRDDFSFRKEGWGGDHQFKVGAELLKTHFGGFFTPTLYGMFYYGNSLGADVNSYLNSIADTFSGSAQPVGAPGFDDNWTYLAGYVQDDWKPTSNVTLNIGLRYEVQKGPYDNNYDTIARRDLVAAGYNADRHLDKNNFGPRLGFAWDVNGNAKVVVRGGYGRYYDEIFQNITLYEFWTNIASPTNFITLSPAPFTPTEYASNRESIRAGLLDPTFAGQVLRYTAPGLQQPYADQFNGGFSMQLSKSVAFDIDYVHQAGKSEIHRWVTNVPYNVSTRETPAGVYDPSVGPIRIEGNRGHSVFDAVYVTGKARSPKLDLITTYAWSKGKNCSNDFNSYPGSPVDPGEHPTNANIDADCAGDYAPTPNDIRHRGTLGAIYQLPAGFQYSTALQANSGKPFSPLLGKGGDRSAVRAFIPGTNQRFDRNSFRVGDSGDTHQSIPFFSWDMRLAKMFTIAKERKFEVLFEVFNVTNHANFDSDSYVTTFSSPNFGNPTAVLKNSQRQAQFGARFSF